MKTDSTAFPSPFSSAQPAVAMPAALSPPGPPGTAPLPVDKIAEALAGPGWCVLDDALPADLCAALLARATRLDREGWTEEAGIGRGQRHHTNSGIRKSAIWWLTAADPAEAAYLGLMNGLRDALNRRLFLGLFDYEAHFAVYPPGGFYARHLDALKGSRNRVVTTVAYLHPDWRQEDGGALQVWAEDAPPDAHPIAELAPRAGRLVVFLSEAIPHAVLPTHRSRIALPGWFRVNGNQPGRVDPPR